MRLRFGISGLLVSLFVMGIANGQMAEWYCFKPLVTTRPQIERVLGKPKTYFPNFGEYETSYGRYSVWYASGRCRKSVTGRDWNVDAGKMTTLLVYPNKAEPASHLRDGDYKRVPAPGTGSRSIYMNSDQSLLYETIGRENDLAEFIYSISLEPGLTKDRLLCR